MESRRKKIRAIILSVIALAAIATAVFTLQIDPADYRAEIKKSIATAQQLLDGAVTGNENGQYSEDQLLWLQTAVETAQKVVDNDVTEIEDFREQSQKLNEEIKAFDGRKNTECLSEEELVTCQQDGKTYTRELTLEDHTKLAWSLDCASIATPMPVNFGATVQGFYQEKAEAVLAAHGISGKVLTLLHNGALPGRADIELTGLSTEAPLYLYEYRPASDALVYVSETKAQDGAVRFSVASGGTWVLCGKAPQAEEEPGEADGAGGEQEKSSSGAGSEVSSAESTAASSVSAESPEKEKPASSSASPDKNASSGGNYTIPGNTPTPEPEEKKLSCTIEIRCDTILNNWKDLAPEKAPYVPANGIILQETTVEFTEGETAFEVLKRVTRSRGIQMEFRNDPTYSGAYIEGINHLYEFDCGSGSGWMYKVNGWFPNYGCGNYKMQDGDKMVWCYTCNVGKDVGDQYWDTH